MDSKWDESSSVGIPIFLWIKSRKDFPKWDRVFVGVASGKKIDSVEITSKINNKRSD